MNQHEQSKALQDTTPFHHYSRKRRCERLGDAEDLDVLQTSPSLVLPLSFLQKLPEARGILRCPTYLGRVGENGIVHIASQSMLSFSENNEMGLRHLERRNGQHHAGDYRKGLNLPDLGNISGPRQIPSMAEMPSLSVGACAVRPSPSRSPQRERFAARRSIESVCQSQVPSKLLDLPNVCNDY